MKFCNDFYETIENDNELQEQISKKLEEYGELNFREAVYVPFCISLISKYPYFNQMEKCLESIRIMLANYNAKSKEINDLIHYIVKSIPIPPVNTKLKFPLPFTPEFIDIMSPYYQDMCLLGSDITCLINLFSIENIIFIFRLMIFEQKILLLTMNMIGLVKSLIALYLSYILSSKFSNITYIDGFIHTFQLCLIR